MNNRPNRTPAPIRWTESLEPRCLLAAPVLDAIADTAFPAGKSLILPLTAADADGDPLSYSFSSDNPAVSVQLHTGNPFLRLSVANFGNIDIELLRDVAPRAVDTIAGLVQAGFYDGLTFHRVIKGFMVQGGDPSGDGTGGPGFQWDDEFNPSAIFTGTGQLAMAKSNDDTNGSQFFITDSSPRYLDFNHTIFGQVVRGMDVVRAIENVPRNSDDLPLTPVVITSASLIDNTSDAVVTLSSTSAATANVTVSVSDGHGGVSTRVFRASTAADSYQGQPWNDPGILGPVRSVTTPVNTPVTIDLTATDLENDPQTFDAITTDNPANATVTVSGSRVTVTPKQDYTGIVHVLVGVKGASDNGWDTQQITVAVGDQPITATAPAAFNGIPGQATSLDVATFTDADPAGQAAGYTASINWGDGHVSTGTITKSGSTFTVRGTNTYANRGRYPITVTITGTAGATDTTRSTAYVEPANASIQLDAGADATVDEGGLFARTIGYTTTVAGDLSATADYGDGSGTQPVVLRGGKLVLSHSYAIRGQYPLTLTVTDGRGHQTTDTLSVTAVNAAPTVSVAGETGGLIGQVRTISFTASDPSPADMAAGFSYMINWGDGSPAQTMPAGSTSASHAFILPGVYNVQVTATDKDGAISTPQLRTMVISAAQLQPDPGNARKTALVIAGTAASDRINLIAGKKGIVKATLNGISLGSFKPTGRIIVYGGDGNDVITVDPKITLTAELHGEAGNDALTGGSGNDILIGGAGNDLLKGNGGLDLLIGGVGKDKLYGGDGEDILIADSTSYDSNSLGLSKILAEWTRPNVSYALRTAHLAGKGGGLNGAFRLKGPSLQPDAFADVLSGDAGNDALWLNTKVGTRDKALRRMSTEMMTDM